MHATDPQNVPSALFGLGYMYLAGYGVVLDHRKAFKYFSQAAEQARLLPPVTLHGVADRLNFDGIGSVCSAC